ncbi:MAG: hypothetical protein AB4368_17110 [Xenococcaceae cyanobacterium]
MGEAKRRKKLDPNFGKGFGRNQKQGKQKQGLMDSRQHFQSFDLKEGKLPQKYIELIANPEWHDWSIAPEAKARMEANAKKLGFPLAMIDSFIQQHQKNVEVVIQLAGLVLGEQEIPQGNKNLSPQLTEIVKELAEMILADAEPALSGKRSPFSVNQERIERVKAIGSQLNELGGTDLMGSLATNYVPPCDQQELDLLWNGIGDWRA